MGAVRVRWSTLARRLGAGALALAALQGLPSLLRPPEPPPPAADVGLPRIAPQRAGAPARAAVRPRAGRARPAAGPPALARLSPARALTDRPETPETAPAPAPASSPAPPAASTPAPPPDPAPPPPPPGDGSVEFMPH